MKKNYYAKALALTVAASMVSVPAFAAEENDAATLQADAEGGIATLPMLDEVQPVVVAEQEEEVTEEEPTETPTTHSTTENEPVALAEDVVQDEIAISSADQIYALARILGDKGTDADYQLFIPENDAEVTDDETASALTDEEKTALKAKLQTATYKLAEGADIILDDQNNTFYGIPNFKGTFDGQGNTIEVAFNIEDAELTGNAIGCLFSTLDGGTVKDVNFTGSLKMTNVKAAKNLQDIAVVVGRTSNGVTIEKVTSDVTMELDLENTWTSEYQTSQKTCVYAGAIIGRTGGADQLTECVNRGNLTANYQKFEINGGCRLGGLVGHAYPGVTFANCENYGDIDTSASDTRTNANGMVGTGEGSVYTNCKMGGNVKGNGYAVSGYPDMVDGSKGNVLVAAVEGKAEQVIAYGSETKTLDADGTVTFEIPVERKNGLVENNTFSYAQYLTVDGQRLDWFSWDNKELKLKLSSDAAKNMSAPFQSEATALEIDTQEKLITLQKALNTGNTDAINQLYAWGGLDAPTDYVEATTALQTGYYKLANDIEIDNADFSGIGTETTPFSGHFDGQEKTVTLKRFADASAVTTNNYALFGYVKNGASGTPEIKDLTVDMDAVVVFDASDETRVGAVAGYINAGDFENVKAVITHLQVTGATGTLKVGGLAGTCNANSLKNVSVEVNGSLAVADSGANIHLGGAFGEGLPVNPITVTYNEGATLTANKSTAQNAICVGGLIGYKDSKTIDLRGCQLVNKGTDALDIKGTAKNGTVLAGGWVGYATSAKATSDDWVYVNETTKMEGKFSVTAGGAGTLEAGGVIGNNSNAYSVSIENYINRADVKGSYAGGFIGYTSGGDSTHSKTVTIKNSANVGTLDGTTVGGFVGANNKYTNTTIECDDALYLKNTTVIKGVGNITDDENGMVGFDTAKVTPAEGKTFTFGTPIENVLTADAPAALTIEDNAEFNGTSLVYTKAGDNQDITFFWNGEEIYKTTVNVAPKALTTNDVTITGVNDKYTSDDAAKAAIDNIKVLDGDKVLVKGTDYDVKQESGKFTIEFKGNYKGTAEKTYSTENAFDVTVKDYVGNYDGKAYGIDITNVPEGVTMQYKEGTGSYSDSAIEKVDAGVYTVEWQATKGQQTVTGTALIQINKAPVTLTADRISMRGAGTVTLTVNGVVESELSSVEVVSDDVNVSDNDGVYTVYLPNATKTYTFTVKVKDMPATRNAFDKNNYEWDDTSCTVSVSRKKSSSSSDTSAPTYSVNTGKTENGTISVTPAKAEAGEKVTIKATPDSGYQLDKITVKDKNNSTVKLTKVDENEYTFTMPSGKVSVDATFVQKDATDDNQNNASEKSKVIKLQIGSRIVTVDNEAVIYDVAPVIRNDRTLVPIRIVTETLGGKVDWNGVTKEVTLTIDGKEIKMTVGKTLEKYGVAPVIIDGRTFVPVRFVADELGATVAWDDATKTVTITKIEK